MKQVMHNLTEIQQRAGKDAEHLACWLANSTTKELLELIQEDYADPVVAYNDDVVYSVSPVAHAYATTADPTLALKMIRIMIAEQRKTPAEKLVEMALQYREEERKRLDTTHKYDIMTLPNNQRGNKHDPSTWNGSHLHQEGRYNRTPNHL